MSSFINWIHISKKIISITFTSLDPSSHRASWVTENYAGKDEVLLAGTDVCSFLETAFDISYVKELA